MRMNLKTRLVLSFVGVSIFVLIIFGYVSYRITFESGIEREAALTRAFIRQEAVLLSSRYADDTALDPVHSAIAALGADRQQLILLVDDQGDYTVSTPLPDYFGAGYRQLPLTTLVRVDDKEGEFSFEGDEFVWISAVIEGSPYKLVIVQRLQKEAPAFMQSQLGRLLITGAIVVWIATWAALILTAFITKRLDRQNRALVHQALHDELTDLPNRTLLFDSLDQVLRRDDSKEIRGALLVMDLDHFKEINDTLGHNSGDLLLRQVGTRIRGMIRKTDTVARLGGDEFAVLLPGLGAELGIERARKIIEVLEKPFDIEGMHLDIETSIGITLFPDHGKDADTLIRRADVAMYHAKNKGCGYYIYEAEADPYSMRRLALTGELRYAIEQNELTLHYQPKVDLRTGLTTGVEALVRWNHPQHGFIPPDEFVPLAERTGLIRPLTLWVLNAALRQNHIWRMMGIDLIVAVNLSARNLQESKLSDQIIDLLEAWNVPAASLMVEVTESALMEDHAGARKILTDIKCVGVDASLDDFGTGYSSLAYLSQLPIAEIKIDRSFVMDMTSNEQNAAIVRSTIDLGHNLKRIVTAEGVEDRKTLDILKSWGCDKAQGYFLSRPLPANELVEWLRGSEWSLDNKPPQLLTDSSLT